MSTCRTFSSNISWNYHCLMYKTVCRFCESILRTFFISLKTSLRSKHTWKFTPRTIFDITVGQNKILKTWCTFGCTPVLFKSSFSSSICYWQLSRYGTPKFSYEGFFKLKIAWVIKNFYSVCLMTKTRLHFGFIMCVIIGFMTCVIIYA